MSAPVQCNGGINRARALVGLPPVRRKKTHCLRCRKVFVSRNYPSVRMCDCCKKTLAYVFYSDMALSV